jgi:uncharacterized protein (UPF0332 family)
MTIQKEEYINYRLQRTLETLNDAKLLASNGSWNSTVNRLYYACFYAVSALLFSLEIEAKTHKGVRIKFMSEFIRSGKIDKEFGKLYSDLFDFRQESDYSDFISPDKELILSLLKKSEEFIGIIRKILVHGESVPNL